MGEEPLYIMHQATKLHIIILANHNLFDYFFSIIKLCIHHVTEVIMMITGCLTLIVIVIVITIGCLCYRRLVSHYIL